MTGPASGRTDLALLALGGIGVARLLLSIAALAVNWAEALGAQPNVGMTLDVWRTLTAHGVAVADLCAAAALVVLARAAPARLDRALALAAATAFAASAIAVVLRGDAGPGAGAIAAAVLAPLAFAAWLAREAGRLRRAGLLVAALALAAVAAVRAALPFFAAATWDERLVDEQLVDAVRSNLRAYAGWSLMLRIEHALLAALPLLALLHRREARRRAEPAMPLPEPRWERAESALAASRHALFSKALLALVTLGWAVVFGAGPSLPGPAMLAAAATGLALGSLWTLWALSRWITSPARSASARAAAVAAALALAAEIGVAAVGWSVAHAHERELVYTRELLIAVVVLVGANLAVFFLVVAALHRLALRLSVGRAARALTRVGVLALIAFAIPWSAWIGRGLGLLLDPWALSACLVAATALFADLAVLALVMSALERKIRRGREAAGVAARFS